METRKVTVTATRYYSKQTTDEIDVPVLSLTCKVIPSFIANGNV